MEFNLKYTDRRHRYHKWFFAYLSFGKKMGISYGPLGFCQACEWFATHYGASAEVTLWHDMRDWRDSLTKMGIQAATSPQKNSVSLASEKDNNIDKYVNPHWAWSNGTEDLRIYICSEKELNFFHISNSK